MASVCTDRASRRKSPQGLEHCMRILSGSWASPSLPLRRIYTDSSDSDRVVTQEAATAVVVETMAFARRDEVEAAMSSTHLTLGTGPKESTFVGIGKVTASPRRQRGGVRCSARNFPTSV